MATKPEEKSKTYIVKAALVVAFGSDGIGKYLYRGSVIPDGIKADDIKRFVDDGLVVESPEPGVIPGVAVEPS